MINFSFFRVRYKSAFFWIVVSLIWSPSIVWVAKDAQIWAWDQAFYADSALNLLHSFLAGNMHQWVSDLLSTTPSKPPLLVWLEQIPLIFIPLVHSAEKCLLVFQIGLSILCIYTGVKILSKITKDIEIYYLWALGLSGNLLFVGLAHQNFVEPLQLIILLLTVNNYLSIKLKTVSFSTGLIRSIFLFVLSAMAKTTTPVLVCAFTFLSVLYLFRRFQSKQFQSNSIQRNKTLALPEIIMFLFFTVISAAWCARNIESVITHLKFSVQPDPIYSTGLLGWSKITYWGSIVLGNSRLLIFTMAVFMTLILFQTIFSRIGMKKISWKDNNSRLEIEIALGFTAILDFSTAVYADNSEPRFLLVGVGSFALLIAVLFIRLKSKPIKIFLLVCLLISAFYHQTNMLTPNADNSGVAWNVSFKSDDSNFQIAKRILKATCQDDGLGHAVMLGVDLQTINPNSWNFINHQLAFEKKTSYYCNIFGINYASRSIDDEKRKIVISKPEFFITLEDKLLSPEILPNSRDLNFIASDLKETLLQDNLIHKVSHYSNGWELFKFSSLDPAGDNSN